MKLYIKQKVFSWGDKFTVRDESGEDRYYVEQELLTWGKTLHICRMTGEVAATLKRQVWTWMPKFQVFCGERMVAEIRKEFSFFTPRYVVEGLGWEIEGEIWAHDYRINEYGRPIASISKKWMTWGDSYELNILDPAMEIVALAVVLAIDCVQSSDGGVSVSVSSS